MAVNYFGHLPKAVLTAVLYNMPNISLEVKNGLQILTLISTGLLLSNVLKNL